MDAGGRFIPDFVPGVSWLFNWQAVRGAQMDTDTTSIYLHDRWAYNRHWTFDLGARYERVRSNATGDIVGADTDTWVPRLAASYDIRGDGRFVAQASYAHYAGKYSEAQFTSNTDVGNPSLVWYGYTGPSGQGLDFAPGFDPANYSDILFGSFATANVFFEDGLSSALNKEFTLSFGSEIGRRGYGKVTFVRRRTSDIIDDFIDTTTGATEVIRDGVNFGMFDNIVYRNAPDDLFREYRALVFQGRYRLTDRWVVEGHWTVQLMNEGNTEGELSNQPGVPSFYGDYPEVFNATRHFPTGRVNDFQRSKIRLWTIYTLGLGKYGDVRPDRPVALQHRSNVQPGCNGRAAERSAVRDCRRRRISERAGRWRAGHFLREAGKRHVSRLRRRRFRRRLLDSRVENPEAVLQVRGAEHVQQPEDDRLRHDDYGRLGWAARQPRAAVELHEGTALW
jgi:TonB dependent receptor